MTAPPPSRGRVTIVGVVIAVLLLAPFVGLLWVSSYAKAAPELFGFPFFYWYQLLWVIISAICTLLAYLLVRGRDRRNARAAAADAERSADARRAGGESS